MYSRNSRCGHEPRRTVRACSPVDFNWRISDPAHTHWLYVTGKCVAAVMQRVNGTWCASMDRHLWSPDVTRECDSEEAGMMLVEEWAAGNIARLRSERSAMPDLPACA